MIRIGNKVVAGSADVDLSTVLKSLNKAGLSVWVGTQTEHDALAESVKNNEKTTFITYDTDEDVFLIIDTIISYGKTWSSVKISSELAKKINASDVYTKEQVDEIINAKLASALKYRGAVNTTALLPGSAENGDTYFVKADGFMYAYNSTTSVWDALGTVADMTNYFTKAEITAMLQDKADKFQYDVLPAPSSETVGLLLQYTGADTQDYKNSYFYKGIDKGNDTYDWELAKICDCYSKSEVDDLLENKVDYKVVVENGSRYVEDIVTQEINNWLPNDNSSILINLKKADGANYANFQLLCNKQDSNNWSCIVSGGVNALWKIRYVNGVRYIDELATKSDLTAATDITLTTYANSAYSIIELKAVRLGLNTVQVAGILGINAQCETLTFASGLPIPKVVTLSPHSMQIQAMCYRGTSSGASERILINKNGSMTVYTNTSGGNLYFSCEYACM